MCAAVQCAGKCPSRLPEPARRRNDALEDNKDFPGYDVRILGDIYISLEKAHSQAEEYGHSFKREICFLAVHGFLHLLGYDHMEKEEEKIMFARQELILNETGITK